MALNQNLAELDIQNALKEVIDPNTGKDFISSKSAKNIKLDGNNVSLDIVLSYPAKSQFSLIQGMVQAQLKTLTGIGNVTVNNGTPRCTLCDTMRLPILTVILPMPAKVFSLASTMPWISENWLLAGDRKSVV